MKSAPAIRGCQKTDIQLFLRSTVRLAVVPVDFALKPSGLRYSLGQLTD